MTMEKTLKRPFRRSALPALLMAAGTALIGRPVAAPETSLGGEGWSQHGRVMHSSDTSNLNYNGNFIHASGAQFLLKAKFSEQLRVSIGLGVTERHYLSGTPTNSRGRVASVVQPYIVEADFGYSFWDRGDSKLRLSGGFLPYNYNPDVKNLGLYLLRGPVYPGILISGFETKHVQPLANILGFQLHHESGGFQQDLILNTETDIFPIYDLSPAYIASYRFGSAFRIGAGVNLYHWIPIEKKLTTPSTPAPVGEPDDTAIPVTDPLQRLWIYVDTTGRIRDTTYLSFKGTKVMANASLDPKAFFPGGGMLGPEDLKIYTEIALIGLDRSKVYKAIYGDYSRRMPVMVGCNFPAFGWLDHLSLETQWYGAKFRDDLQRYQPTTARSASPLPEVNSAHADLGRDDWKWSVHSAKTFDHLRLSVQIANDHSRPAGKLLDIFTDWQALYTTPQDWYLMAKASFFF
jgi:hypothetical protein